MDNIMGSFQAMCLEPTEPSGEAKSDAKQGAGCYKSAAPGCLPSTEHQGAAGPEVRVALNDTASCDDSPEYVLEFQVVNGVMALAMQVRDPYAYSRTTWAWMGDPHPTGVFEQDGAGIEAKNGRAAFTISSEAGLATLVVDDCSLALNAALDLLDRERIWAARGA